MKGSFVGIPVFKLKHEGQFHSPFTGKKILSEDGFKKDRSLLFYFEGEVGEWDYISTRVRDAVQGPKKLEDLTPQGLCRKLNIPGAVCFELDANWNGLRWLAFAPPEEE
jgi:hypothetical protein